MADDKVVRFPITEAQRLKNRRGKFAVECQVSSRWLAFGKRSALLQRGEFLTIDVMTTDLNDKPRKLAELIVTREELMEVLGRVKPADGSEGRN